MADGIDRGLAPDPPHVLEDHEKPGITPGQLADETGLAPNTITKYLRAIREEWQGRG